MPTRLLLTALLLSACAAAEPPPSEPVAARTAPRLSDPQAEAILYALLTPGGDPGWNATASAIVEAEDPRFAAPIIDMLRFRELPHAGLLLTALTGQEFGTDWAAWTEWLGRNPVDPLPGYAAWKGTLLALATDELAFRRFLKPGVTSRIRIDEIAWGGVGVDGIPALQNPKTGDGGYLQFDELVAGVALNGAARAYPLRIIDWHEMVNDVVGGQAVSLAYCTLCGSAVLYAGAVGERTFTFGSSGLLMRSNKLMFDRQTDTLWNQLTGEPVLGELADSGIALERLPVVISTWGEWRRLHPDTTVLSLQTGHQRDYRPGRPYGDYFASDTTMFPVWQRKKVLPDKERVFAMVIDGAPKVWPLAAFDDDRVIEDRIGAVDVVLVGGPEGVETTEPGGRSVRAYRRDRALSEWDDPWRLRDGDGGVWQVTEDALVGPAGQRLERLPGHVAYWFGWFAYFPQTVIYGEPATRTE